MKSFQVKYRGVVNGQEPCLGSRNNAKGRHKSRRRVWNGPRHKAITGVHKRLARLVFDQQVKGALS